MNLSKATAIAYELKDRLHPWCETTDIAGSIRRGKADVGDIEICCLPHLNRYGGDLFGESETYKRFTQFIETVKSFGKIIKGDPEIGRMVQVQIGAANDAADFMNNCIMLDLFIPQREDYFRQFAIRTGSATYSHKVIAAGWLKQGWYGTTDGLRRQDQCFNIGTEEKPKWKCNHGSPVLPPAWNSEEEFFDFIKVKWIEPNLREFK